MKKSSIKSVFSYSEKGIYEFSEEDQLSSRATFIQVCSEKFVHVHCFMKIFLDFDLTFGEPFSYFFGHGNWLSGDNNSAALAK